MPDKKRPILLIDDSDDIRDVFKIWMEMEGYSVETAHSGGQALEWLSNGLHPCIVLVDLSMPDMKGEEFIRAANKACWLEGVPVYIFSAHSTVHHVPGSAGWIKKPVDLDQVLAILSALEQPCAPHDSQIEAP